MAVGDEGVASDDLWKRSRRGTTTAREAQQWLLTLLPAFPVLLLVLRLWHLSGQDLSTMLLLVQNVSPLGLLSALLITLVWVLPAIVLVVCLFGNLLWLSAPDRFDPERSLLARTTVRTPNWVVVAAVLLAALTWQMRFLPTLMMIALALVGLTVRRRHGDRSPRVSLAGVWLPLVAAALAYAWLAPAVVTALGSGDLIIASLLGLPPGLAVLLTGPVPHRSAWALTRGAVAVAAVTMPFLLGAIFLRAPILPGVAVEVDPAEPGGGLEVVLGRVITVNDRMTTLLDDRGTVRFVRNDLVRSQTLCPDPAQVAFSEVRVHGWHVEETALEWLTPHRPAAEPDPRCSGRPLVPESRSSSRGESGT